MNPTEKLCELVRICLICENLSDTMAICLKIALFDCEHPKSKPKEDEPRKKKEKPEILIPDFPDPCLIDK